MAQYRVYRLPRGELVVDLQTDHIQTTTRIVARLVPEAETGQLLGDATPVFMINGIRMNLLTTHMGAVPSQALHDQVDDLSAEDYAILRAIDMVFTGV
jgi:toxin CcdB